MGSVEAEFLATARRFAGPMRATALTLISVFGFLAVPADAVPLGLALLGLVVAGAVADCWTRIPRWAALAVAVARVVALLATQEWTGAHPNQWAVNALTTTAITLQWDFSPKIAWPVIGGLLAVHLAVAGIGTAGVIGPRLLIECSLAQLGFVLLRRSCRRVDELRARGAELARAEAVALARHRREREYLALLHDTASATFLMVAVPGADTEGVAEYARHDLAVLTGTAGGPTTQDSPVDMAASLRSVVDRGPLTVDAQWRDAAPVPASVALALVRAVHEALTNVERHAGVTAASVCVATEGDRVVVTVRDEGAGFEPGEVPSSRRGIRGSIVERMAAVGGGATITSHPGAGTAVRLVWPDG